VGSGALCGCGRVGSVGSQTQERPDSLMQWRCLFLPSWVVTQVALGILSSLILVFIMGCRPAPSESPRPTQDARPVAEKGTTLVKVDGLKPVLSPMALSLPRIVEPAMDDLVLSDDVLLRWEPPAPDLPERFVAQLDDGPWAPLFPGDRELPLVSLSFPLKRPAKRSKEGEHRVVICATRGGRLARMQDSSPACHVVSFFLGRSKSRAVVGDRRGVVVVAPHGTYTGPLQSHRVPFEAFFYGDLDGAREKGCASASIRLEQQGNILEYRATLAASYELENLLSGDYRLQVRCVGPDDNPVGGRWMFLERQFTINADGVDEISIFDSGVVSPPEP